MRNYSEIKEKIAAAKVLLSESTTSREKLVSLTSLLTGAHPKTDKILRELNKHLTTLVNIEKGDVIQLSADNLPENTEEDKKRKRALLLFIKTWKDLQSEFARVQEEFEKAEANGNSGNASVWGKIFSAAKGPLAIVTVVVIGAVTLQTTAVTIEIQNDGCGIIESASSVPISIPGLSLPNDAIASGESAEATIPPLSLTVDGTSESALNITSLGFSLSIELDGVDDITFDGESLLNKQTEIALSESKTHTLVISCR